jgi:hypothetical protein
VDDEWRTLYRTGALAPLVAVVLYASQFIILAFGEPYPASAEGWFALVQRSRLLSLWYLNAADIVSITLLGIMFLALYLALRRFSPSWMLIALYLALVGVVVFVVPRVLTLAVVPLSDLHASATGEAQRTLYLAAGETLSRVTTATPQTLGFFLMAVAGLIISGVILHSPVFGRVVAYIGIVAFVAAVANVLGWMLAPSVAMIALPINGLLWLVWWLVVSVGLLRLASAPRDMDTGP